MTRSALACLGLGRLGLGLSTFALAIGLGPCFAKGGEDNGRATVDRPVISRQQIEADWLRQDQVRSLPPTSGGVTSRDDAAGGCDGVKDGRFGFHTGQDNEPWWQVDLGSEMTLDQALIYNRCDGSMERAFTVKVLLSSDGQTWSTAYQHDGTAFFGVTDVKPLSVRLGGAKARWLRVQLPGTTYLHLDEVEVFPLSNNRNVALGKPADQSSASNWSKRHGSSTPSADTFPVDAVIQSGLKLIENQRGLGVDVTMYVARLEQIAAEAKGIPGDAPPESRREIYFQARQIVRQLALANPLLDFDQLVFVKRVPTSFTHMSDQNYGWFSRPGGGLFVLEGWKGDSPRLRQLAEELPEGNILDPEISYDGTKVLFAHCRFYQGLAEEPDKLDKVRIPEDAFYHVYEINIDGTGLRRLTRGKYDDFSGRYLPSGEIAFLSTRRGQFVRAGRTTAELSVQTAELPDSYVRCGGGSERPVAVYTLHVMNGDGGNLRTISPFENFEWTPNVANDGRLLYARWDYVDRDNMPYMSLWSTLSDGTASQAVYGNYTVSPYCIFETRSIPNSHKFIFTAAAHHAITGGSLVLLDPSQGADGPGALTRLTPEVPFPEVEAWPATYFSNPYPLSEHHHLVAWSDQPLAAGWPLLNPANAMGIYLFDTFGNLNLIYRDPDISSMYPLPVRPRMRPPTVAELASPDINKEGRMLLTDVYQGLEGIERGAIRQLRLVGVPAKTQPTMNSPPLGITHDDPGKFVLGTVPVEEDGSAYFRLPGGVPIFMQALDKDGKAIQTMRSATYVQPGQTYTCVGCHEPRNTAPGNRTALASLREPSRIAPGPDGSWPLDYNRLVQPVLDQNCVNCHRAGGDGSHFDLTIGKSYESLIGYGGERSLRSHVLTAYRRGRSTAGEGASQTSSLLALLDEGHYDVKLDGDARDRLITWMDTYAQRAGSFSPEQDRELIELRERLSDLLGQSAK